MQNVYTNRAVRVPFGDKTNLRTMKSHTKLNNIQSSKDINIKKMCSSKVAKFDVENKKTLQETGHCKVAPCNVSKKYKKPLRYKKKKTVKSIIQDSILTIERNNQLKVVLENVNLVPGTGTNLLKTQQNECTDTVSKHDLSIINKNNEDRSVNRHADKRARLPNFPKENIPYLIHTESQKKKLSELDSSMALERTYESTIIKDIANLPKSPHSLKIILTDCFSPKTTSNSKSITRCQSKNVCNISHNFKSGGKQNQNLRINKNMGGVHVDSSLNLFNSMSPNSLKIILTDCFSPSKSVKTSTNARGRSKSVDYSSQNFNAAQDTASKNNLENMEKKNQNVVSGDNIEKLSQKNTQVDEISHYRKSYNSYIKHSQRKRSKSMCHTNNFHNFDCNLHTNLNIQSTNGQIASQEEKLHETSGNKLVYECNILMEHSDKNNSSIIPGTPVGKRNRMRKKSIFLNEDIFQLNILKSKTSKNIRKKIDQENKTKKTKNLSNNNLQDKTGIAKKKGQTNVGLEGNNHKELCIKILKLKDNKSDEVSQKRNDVDVQIKMKKQMNGNITKEDIQNVAEHKCSMQKYVEKQKLPHNLRKLSKKNYQEISVLESSQDVKDGNMSEIRKKKIGVPIYKTALADNLAESKTKDEIYEFNDISPKPKTFSKKRHRSSLIFDKDTHEILKKLEKREEKAKKVRTKKKITKKVKSYDNIVSDIVKNVKQKIKERKIIKPFSNCSTVVAEVNQQEKLPCSINKEVIPINNMNEELSIIVHNFDQIPSTSQKCISNIKNVTSQNSKLKKRPLNNIVEASENVFSENTNNITLRNNLKESRVQTENNKCMPISNKSIDNTVSQEDIEKCFGFTEGFTKDEDPVVAKNLPEVGQKNTINILSNVILVHNSDPQVIESPVDFNARRPNANSTMVLIDHQNRKSSPWRLDWITRRPHFVSIKGNALPRIDQELVLDHTIVESFENSLTNTSKKASQTPVRKDPVQQSILDFVECNIEKENQPVQGSLFDYDAFNSPIKKDRNINIRANKVKKNILGSNELVASTPVQRRVLVDKSNSLEESPSKTNYFGFEETTELSTSPLTKNTKKSKTQHIKSESNSPKPTRFDLSALRSYAAKIKKKQKTIASEKTEKETINHNPQDKSISLIELSKADSNDVHLFEEPEEMLDNMPTVEIEPKKRQRRKRFDSCDSDDSVTEKKRKKHKKTRAEIEQEEWIENFNKQCEDIDKFELELE